MFSYHVSWHFLEAVFVSFERSQKPKELLSYRKTIAVFCYSDSGIRVAFYEGKNQSPRILFLSVGRFFVCRVEAVAEQIYPIVDL